MPVARSVTQTAVTTPARPAAPGAASSSTRPAVVTGALPPGAGREVVQRVCGSCHGIDTVTAVGRTPAQWSDIIGQMQNMGLSASDDDLATVHAYLSRQLPPK
jgi:mono/diheme cytochrome c family protein